jgi:hypothetical protein
VFKKQNTMKNNSINAGSLLRVFFVFLHVNPKHMYTKLTLNIDKETIEQAKLYAKKQNLSLSKLIETYLQAITQKQSGEEAVSPLVTQLTGIIPADYNEKLDYRAHQLRKHS